MKSEFIVVISKSIFHKRLLNYIVDWEHLEIYAGVIFFYLFEHALVDDIELKELGRKELLEFLVHLNKLNMPLHQWNIFSLNLTLMHVTIQCSFICLIDYLLDLKPFLFLIFNRKILLLLYLYQLNLIKRFSLRFHLRTLNISLPRLFIHIFYFWKPVNIFVFLIVIFKRLHGLFSLYQL